MTPFDPSKIAVALTKAFLAVEGAMLANRRRTRAAGLDGGGEGAPGITRIIRDDGRIELLDACAAFQLAPGDSLEVLTPGGGGCGDA